MKPVFVLIITACLVSACSPSRKPEAAGEYNLSKGQCIDIPDGNKTHKDEMNLSACQMAGGKFVPRNHRKLYWF